MPLTKEQFMQLDAQGFSPEEIASFEQRSIQETQPKQVSKFEQGRQAFLNSPIAKGIDYLLPQAVSERKYAPDTFNIYGDVLQRPMSAVSALVQGKNPLQGYISPSTIPPTAQGLDVINQQNQPTPKNKLQAVMQVLPAALAGSATDVLSNPLTYTGGAISKLGKAINPELGKAGQLVSQYSNPIIQKVAPTLEKAAVNMFNPITNLAKGLLSTSESGSTNFAQDVKQAFIKAHTDKINQFGSDIDKLSIENPDRTISLRDIVDNIKENWNELSSQSKSAFKNNPILGKMIKDPNLADEVTLSDTQKIINAMNTGIPKSIKYQHLDIIDNLNQIRAAQLDAFPEMANVRKDYAQFIEPYKRLQNKFKPYNILDQIQGGFGGAVERQDVGQVFQENPNILQQMQGYKSAKELQKGVGRVAKTAGISALVGGAGYGGYKVAKSVLP